MKHCFKGERGKLRVTCRGGGREGAGGFGEFGQKRP